MNPLDFMGALLEGLFFTSIIMGPLLYWVIRCTPKFKTKSEVNYCKKFEYIKRNITSCSTYQEWINCRNWVDRLSKNKYLSDEALEQLRRELLYKENDIEAEVRKTYAHTLKDTAQ